MDLAQLLGCLEDVFELFGSFYDCDSCEEALVEKAEHTLRDVVYLEPILPEGESMVKMVSDVVVCMREVEASGLQQYEAEKRGRGRPLYNISREQLVFLLEHGFTQCAIAKLMVVVPELLIIESRISNSNHSYGSQIWKTIF